MNIETQVVSLELAKELKENGYPQEGVWWWQIYNDNSWHLKLGQCATAAEAVLNIRNQWCTAPTVAELGERLPFGIVSGKTRERYACSLHFGTPFPCGLNNRDLWTITRTNTEANARAKMWLYLKKNGLLKEAQDE